MSHRSEAWGCGEALRDTQADRLVSGIRLAWPGLAWCLVHAPVTPDWFIANLSGALAHYNIPPRFIIFCLSANAYYYLNIQNSNFTNQKVKLCNIKESRKDELDNLP